MDIAIDPEDSDARDAAVRIAIVNANDAAVPVGATCFAKCAAIVAIMMASYFAEQKMALKERLSQNGGVAVPIYPNYCTKPRTWLALWDVFDGSAHASRSACIRACR